MIRRFILPLNINISKLAQRQSSVSLRKKIQNIVQTPKISYRFLSDSTMHDVHFEQVKKAISNDNIYIIDVREPEEIREHGKIPNSINIPLGQVHTALSIMSDKDFKKAFNKDRPSEDCEIIFYCAIGRRSGMAQQTAYELGYKNVKNYLGSYTDWAKKCT